VPVSPCSSIHWLAFTIFPVKEDIILTVVPVIASERPTKEKDSVCPAEVSVAVEVGELTVAPPTGVQLKVGLG